MPRQLRPRKGRPSYAVLAGYEMDEGSEAAENLAGPSAPSQVEAIMDDDSLSESDFIPAKKSLSKGVTQIDNVDSEGDETTGPEPVDKDADVDGDESRDVQYDMEEADVFEVNGKQANVTHRTAASTSTTPRSKKPTAKDKGKGKAKAESTEGTAFSPVRRSKGKMYALPTPSVHHRHRAVPLYSRAGRTERLTAQPSLFEPPSLTLTTGFTERPKVSERVNKAWGFNVGYGPLWDLAEDRGWYKEATTMGNNTHTEAKRRPRVYPDIRVQGGWEFMSLEAATPYLPTDDTTTEEGDLKPPPPVSCFFGPFKSQIRRDVKMFEAFPMSKYTPGSKAHIFNAGAPVWGIDWCPIHTTDRPARSYKQYLAVAPFPSHSHSPDIGRKVKRPSHSCIQIWSLSPTQRNVSGGKKSKAPDFGQMKCEMVLCLDSGPAYELRWCPLPSHDLKNDNRQPKKLGLLSGTFEDGSFAIYTVPDPSDIVPPDHDQSYPICVKMPHPILRIELEETSCWSFDWANSELIAIGTTNGTILVYNIGPTLKASTDPSCPTITDLLPTHHLAVHQSAIRALGWIKAPPCLPTGVPCVNQDPTVIASGGYDGMECLTDIRDGRGAVINRTRDVINALAFSPFTGGPITMDHENTVKAYSASPSMLGRGHSLVEPQGPVWSVHTSDFHPQLAVGATDGSCSTTNTLRRTRRGGSVPFLVYKIFQMDYNRNTKEYRMLDCFYPQEFLDRPTATRTGKGKSKDDSSFLPSTGAWPCEVGVHRVVWNNGNGLASSSLLAAGTASGLCRIDTLWGRWLKDKVPYGGAEGIRLEDEDAMEVDSEASEGDSD